MRAGWEIVVGIETHTQLLTKSKMFSGSSTTFGATPNSQASAVDIALPGVLPVLNRAAVEHAIRFGLAIGGTINRRSIFARKNYFYPDLPKGYQISQYELPIVQGGVLGIRVNGREKDIRITRAHLEEDAGKSIHGEAISGTAGYGAAGYMVVGKPLLNEDRDLTKLSAIDLNRAGTPLLEIVSEPELMGVEEAVAYARTLHELVVWIGICDGDMEEGSFRCDANVSVRRIGDPKLGTRCELKNLNSFRFMEQAIEFEAKRQVEILEDGGRIAQETRLYDPDRNETRSMRTKEEAHDYRYFPDPDLLPLIVSPEMLEIEGARLNKRGTPVQRRLSYALQYGSELTSEDIAGLTQSRETAEYFDDLMVELKNAGDEPSAKVAANFILGDMAALQREFGTSILEAPIRPAALAGLILHVLRRQISVSTAKKLMPQFWSNSAKTVGELLTELDRAPASSFTPEVIQIYGSYDPTTMAGQLGATSTATVSIADRWETADASQIERAVDEVLAANAKQVADYKAGKEKAFNSLVGQVMKATKGKANPAQVNEILRRKLGG